MPYSTPLRYPGGKGRLAQYVAEIIELNDLSDGCYVEPFCGGAGIALALLYGEKVTKIHLNDLDRSVYAFWHASLHKTDELCALVSDTAVNIDEWHKQREVQKNKENEDLLNLAFSTFFLNRTNRSGILTAGVIGGINQTGKWLIDARYNKESLIERIQKIGRYASRICISNHDAADFITDIIPTLPEKSLVYFDPPYFNKGQQLYRNHYDPEDHSVLARAIQGVGCKWIVSYDNVTDISDLYAQRDQEVFSLNYSAQSHYEGSELMIFCDELKTPESVYASRRRIA